MYALQKKIDLKANWAETQAKRVDRVAYMVNDWTEYWDGVPVTLSPEKMDILFLDHRLAVEVLQHLGYKVNYFHKQVIKNGKKVTKVLYRISL